MNSTRKIFCTLLACFTTQPGWLDNSDIHTTLIISEMKKILFFALASLFLFCNTTEAQFKMDSNGDVGIGYMSTDPAEKLHVRGTAYFNCNASAGLYFTNKVNSAQLKPQWGNSAYIGQSTHRMWEIHTNYIYYNYQIDFSDSKIKENIRSIDSPLSSICQINAIQYDLTRESFMNTPEERIDELVEDGKNKYGVIAQELKEILPDLVVYNKDAELYGVNYIGLIPILVEAIKEQQIQIEELKAAIVIDEALKGASVSTASTDPLSSEVGISTLNQNAPNPFTEETTISYSLSETVGSATLFIYDMSGKQLRSYDLSDRGDSKINILGGELDAGMYMYSLVTDGLLIETKQMILTE